MSWIKKTTNVPSAASAQSHSTRHPQVQGNQWNTDPTRGLNQSTSGMEFPSGTIYGQQHQYDSTSYRPFTQNNQVKDNQGINYNMNFNEQNHPQQNQYVQQNPQGDVLNEWENWGWGDEDNSNVQNVAQQNFNLANSTGADVASSAVTARTEDQTWDWTADGSSSLHQNMHQRKDEWEPSRNMFHTPFPGQNQQASIDSQVSQESGDPAESDRNYLMSRSSTENHSLTSVQDPLSKSFSIEDSSNKPEKLQENFYTEKGFSENTEIIHRSEGDNNINSVYATQQLTDFTQSQPMVSTSGYDLHHVDNNQSDTSLDSKATISNARLVQSFNLESPPDNSEHPDSLTHSQHVNKPYRAHQWQENSEIIINDRNQYLETGCLSDVDLLGRSDNKTDIGDALPPPGLRRMVLGQIEQQSNQMNSSGNDEPPPGLSRMVLGQTENENVNKMQSESTNNRHMQGSQERLDELQRMIPGESSSPESTSQQFQAPSRRQEDNYEADFGMIGPNTSTHRSATIGADITPPSSNFSDSNSSIMKSRSETIGAITPKLLKLSQDGSIRSGNSSTSTDSRIGKKTDDLMKKVDQSQKNSKDQIEVQRDPIEGQTENSDLTNLSMALRNITVGENIVDDDHMDVTNSELNIKKTTQQESFDSENDTQGSSSREDHDRAYHEVKSKSGKDAHQRGYGDDLDNHQNVEENTDWNRSEAYRSRKREGGGMRYRDRYLEDPDYYSDRERQIRTERERTYDRQYHSLRKEKEKRRRDKNEYRGSERASERDYRRNDYPDYRDDYGEDSRSRPSSRSGSFHDPHYERGYDRHHKDRGYRHKEKSHRYSEREYHHRDRDRQDRQKMYQFDPYSQKTYAYDPYSQYYQQYQYYESLRRNNPQMYAELYRKYYQQSASNASYGEDRTSVHSGRSSANEEYKNSFIRSYDQLDSSLVEDPTSGSQRMTPYKFATAHLKASISSGKLVKVLPHYSVDGQPPSVDICNLGTLLSNDVEYNELRDFPGPLIKGVTHKKTIIEFCETKIKSAMNSSDISGDDSYILMWRLLILLIKQNGMVVGTDIAELLLKDRNEQKPFSAVSSLTNSMAEINSVDVLEAEQHSNSQPSVKHEEVYHKFMEYLLYGSCKEALELAMKHGLWSYALHLASKLDKRTYANVMMRFENGIAVNSPMHTLFQLLSGKLPLAVTCVADEKWGDWRPHLAMILSNASQRPDLSCVAITTLGDTLLNCGNLYAAQFCYLMAEVGFGQYGDASSKLVLLGADHSKPFAQFATNDAIQMTEIYEYACSLSNNEYSIPGFASYKFLLASRLSDYGFLEKSLSYLEVVGKYIVANSGKFQSDFVNKVYRLADKLKYYDPFGNMYENTPGDQTDVSRLDSSWLRDLQNVRIDDYPKIIESSENFGVENQELPVEVNQTPWQESYQEAPEQQWPVEQSPVLQGQEEYEYHQEPEDASYQNQDQSWNTQAQWGTGSSSVQDVTGLQDYYQPDSNIKDFRPPQISLPNQMQARSQGDESLALTKEEKKQAENAKTQSQDDKPASTGWFGGIFSRLAPKPKNQMKLPDDKDPTIIWDPVKKRWIDKNNDGTNSSEDFKPPPKMNELFPKVNPPQDYGLNQNIQPIQPVSHPPGLDRLGNVPQGVPGPAVGSMVQETESDNGIQKIAQPNIFKLQGRGRSLKSSYVDVFNPQRKPPTGQKMLPNSETRNIQSQMNFFIPQPVNDPSAPTDFLTPAMPVHSDDLQASAPR